MTPLLPQAPSDWSQRFYMSYMDIPDPRSKHRRQERVHRPGDVTARSICRPVTFGPLSGDVRWPIFVLVGPRKGRAFSWCFSVTSHEHLEPVRVYDLICYLCNYGRAVRLPLKVALSLVDNRRRDRFGQKSRLRISAGRSQDGGSNLFPPELRHRLIWSAMPQGRVNHGL